MYKKENILISECTCCSRIDWQAKKINNWNRENKFEENRKLGSKGQIKIQKLSVLES